MGVRNAHDQSLARALSNRFRMKRDRALRELIERLHIHDAAFTILDMGGSVDYWRRVGFDFLRAKRCKITILNISASDLGAGGPKDIIDTEVGDATDLSRYADQSFELTHSNSVIEHLGAWDTMSRFAAEAQRVGRAYYLQTPNFWFPVDPHYYALPFFHWLPRPARAALFRRFSIAQGGRVDTWDAAFAITDASRLLVRPQLQCLFPNCRISSERLLGLTKSLIVTGAAPRP